MKQILGNIIKRKVINYIKRYGDGVPEVIIDISLSFGICNSIELIEVDNENLIYVHIFDDDLDIISDFDDL
jgi:hypothetical protein